MRLATVTIRPPGWRSGRSNPVSAKWPRKLVAIWISKPSADARRGPPLVPALLMSMSRPRASSTSRRPNRRTESSSERSISATARLASGTVRVISSTARRVAHSQDHLGPGRGEQAARLQADPAAGPGDDGSPPGEVRDVPLGPGAPRHAILLGAADTPMSCGRRRAALDLHRDQYRRCDSAPWLNGNAHDLAVVPARTSTWRHVRHGSRSPT